MFGKKIVLVAISSVLLFASGSNKNIEQPTKYVYSSSKIEYANVATIERLKRAVVLLINKVENLEKKLDIEKNSSLKIKKTDKLNKIVLKNSKELSHLLKIMDKKSKYDEQIIEFINKK